MIRAVNRSLINKVIAKSVLRPIVSLRTYTSASAPRVVCDLPDSQNVFRSNAETLVNSVPVIEVDGTEAVCDGGGGALGHPIQYMALVNGINEDLIVTCKYCGLRYKRKK